MVQKTNKLWNQKTSWKEENESCIEIAVIKVRDLRTHPIPKPPIFYRDLGIG